MKIITTIIKMLKEAFTRPREIEELIAELTATCEII